MHMIYWLSLCMCPFKIEVFGLQYCPYMSPVITIEALKIGLSDDLVDCGCICTEYVIDAELWVFLVTRYET